MIITDKIQELFKIASNKISAPIRTVQLTDDQMCDLLGYVIGDYSEVVQNWVTETQWLNLQGNQKLLKTRTSKAYALTRTMGLVKRDIQGWFSREVGFTTTRTL